MPDFFRGKYYDPYDKNNTLDDQRNFIQSVAPLSSLEQDIFDKLLPKIHEEKQI